MTYTLQANLNFISRIVERPQTTIADMSSHNSPSPSETMITQVQEICAHFDQMQDRLQNVCPSFYNGENLRNFVNNVTNAKIDAEQLLKTLSEDCTSQVHLNTGDIASRNESMVNLRRIKASYDPFYDRILGNVRYGVVAAFEKKVDVKAELLKMGADISRLEEEKTAGIKVIQDGRRGYDSLKKQLEDSDQQLVALQAIIQTLKKKRMSSGTEQTKYEQSQERVRALEKSVRTLEESHKREEASSAEKIKELSDNVEQLEKNNESLHLALEFLKHNSYWSKAKRTLENQYTKLLLSKRKLRARGLVQRRMAFAVEAKNKKAEEKSKKENEHKDKLLAGYRNNLVISPYFC